MKRSIVCVILAYAAAAGAALPPAGEVSRFASSDGVEEQCIRVAGAPGARYSSSDKAAEEAFCAIDFHAPDVALCPKIWSTSPGTIVHRVSGDARDFERRACARGTHARDLALEELAVFKMSMNAVDTSATFAPAALLYYHVSRWFGAAVDVPPSVYRSVGRQEHLRRVVRPGVELTAGHDNLAMIHAGWSRMAAGHESPATYNQRFELYEPGHAAVYGILIDEKGRRYGAEINGTRASGWGRGQNEDFQKTAPFLALRTPGPLAEAIDRGIAEARRDPAMARDLGTPRPVQVAFWMRELVDITLLDFIFSQQDRIGNIDYETWWYWVADGEVRRAPGSAQAPSPDAMQLRRSILNDNDAAGRIPYANYAKTTGMLEGLRHYPAETYRQLMRLDRDFQTGGPMSTWLAEALPLSAGQERMIKTNTQLAAQTLRAACESGQLSFDLDPEQFLVSGEVRPEVVKCDGT